MTARATVHPLSTDGSARLRERLPAPALGGRLPPIWALSLPFACALACARPQPPPAEAPATQLAIALVLPDSPDPSVELVRLRVTAAWGSGDAGVVLPFGDGGVYLTLPVGPLDLLVEGLGPRGDTLWRGVAHSVDLAPSADGGAATATVFLGKVGAFASFYSVKEFAPTAGAQAVSWGPGKVLFVGGRKADGSVSSAVWLYDESTVRVTPFGQSLDPRAHALALAWSTPSGVPLLFLAGGDGRAGGATASAELLLADGGGLKLPPLSQPQRFPAGALDPSSGRLLVGCGEGAALPVADLYLPATALGDGGEDGFVAALPLAAACVRGRIDWSPALSANLLGDTAAGLVRVDADGGASPWGGVQAMRQGFFAVPVGAGLLQLGGEVAGTAVATSELHGDGGVSLGPLLTEPRADFAGIVTPGGRLLLVGGRGADGGALSSAEWVDPERPTGWPAGSMARARIHPAVADLPAYGAAVVFSGEDAAGRPVAGLEIYTYP